jgi:hypothetical protein
MMTGILHRSDQTSSRDPESSHNQGPVASGDLEHRRGVCGDAERCGAETARTRGDRNSWITSIMLQN